MSEREQFEAALAEKPEVRFWNTTDAMFWAWQASRAQPAQAGQVLTDEEIDAAYEKARAGYQRSRFAVRGQQLTAQDSPDWWFARAIEQSVLAKRVPMTDDTALIRQLAAALDRCRFDSLNMSVADMRALSEARTAASKRLCIVGEKGGAT